MKIKRSVLSVLLALAMVLTYMPATAFAGGEASDAAQKNSSYGFFVWLSENASTDSEKEDAAIAAQIIANTLTDANKSKVYNRGNIIGGNSDISYNDLLASVDLGGENDATSLDNLKAAVDFIISGNAYRAKESLPALKVSSALMAMAELNADYQDIDYVFDHSNVFSALENLAYRQIGGTWQYGEVGGGMSDDPYEGWYTKEKENYDTNNGDQTGHYLTLTDRNGAMLITGFGVRSSFTSEQLKANDGKLYDCLMHDRYYSQMFSTKSDMYDVGNGVTPAAYLAYIDAYQSEIGGQTTDPQTQDSQQGGEQTTDPQTPGGQQGSSQKPDAQTPGGQQSSGQTPDIQITDSQKIPEPQTQVSQQGSGQKPDAQSLDKEEKTGTPTIKLSASEFTYKYVEKKTGKKKKKVAVATVQRPEVEAVTLNGKTVSANNYDVVWSNKDSSEIGAYTVTVTLKGGYSGKGTATYTINPKGVKLKKLAKGKKKFTASWKKLSTKDVKYKVISGFQLRYSTDPTFPDEGTKVIKAGTIKKTKKAVSKLKSKTTYYVQLRTHKTVKGVTYYSGWSSTKKVKTK